MIYILDDKAGEKTLQIRGDLHKYLIKVRRHKEGDLLSFRARENMQVLYTYKLQRIEARDAELLLLSKQEVDVKSKKSLHIGWCVIDVNSIEKVLPSLCEIGVERISFITCERSQKNFKLDFKRFDRIQEAAMQQCGRSTYVEFDTYKNIREFIEKFPHVNVFDFCENRLQDYNNIETILIGCEGGFSPKERELLSPLKRFRLGTDMVLRSESAVVAISSKILL